MLLPLIVILSVAGLLFNYLFERMVVFNSQISGAYKVNRMIRETHADEIPILGSSRAEGGFIPDSLGKDFFNYGLSGSKYDVTLFFLEEECKKTKSRPWIILNLDLDGLLHGLGDVGNYVPNTNYKAVKDLLGSEYQPFFNIPFIKYYGRYESYYRDYLNEKMQLTKFTNKGASIEKNVLTKKQFDELVEQRRKSSTAFVNDSGLMQKLVGLITAHPERQFLFVISPYHESFFAQYVPDGETNFANRLQLYKNVHLLDFSNMPLPDDMFMNTSHLNLKGAIKFNRQLRDTLTVMGVK